jgi:hypothetical protein
VWGCAHTWGVVGGEVWAARRHGLHYRRQQRGDKSKQLRSDVQLPIALSACARAVLYLSRSSPSCSSYPWPLLLCTWTGPCCCCASLQTPPHTICGLCNTLAPAPPLLVPPAAQLPHLSVVTITILSSSSYVSRTLPCRRHTHSKVSLKR